MAKIPFSKLDIKVCDTSCTATVHNSKGEPVQYEIKYYLPVEEKLEMISNIINQSVDDNGFYNPMRVQIFTVLEVMYAYTNLNFTEKQKENPFKLYDQLVSSGLFHDTISHIWEKDWQEIETTILETIQSIYKYKNSVLGILDAVSSDYSNLELDATKIQQTLADPDNMALLKSVLTKLG